MISKLATLTGLALAALMLAVSCLGDGSSPAPSPAPSPAVVLPSPTPEPTPTATPTPTPTLMPTTGVLVFLRGTDLWVASLDGGESLPPRAITSGSLLAQYAGSVRRPDGGVDLYYTSWLTEEAEVNGRAVAEFGLYRVPLEGGTPEELFRFFSGETTFFNHYFSSSDASVSPDGGHITYADAEGLVLLELASSESTRLLENGNCIDPDSKEACWAYADPQWAPNGDVALVQKGLWESAVNILVRPFESPVGVIETTYGSGRPDLSPDGEQLCIWDSFGIDDSRLVIYHIPTGEVTDVRRNLPPVGPGPFGSLPNILGCAWSEDRRLAVGYSPPDVGGPERIAILDADFSVAEESDTIENLRGVVAWLPDASGVVFNRSWSYLEGEPLPRPPGIFHLQRGIMDLPSEADRVLAVIP